MIASRKYSPLWVHINANNLCFWKRYCWKLERVWYINHFHVFWFISLLVFVEMNFTAGVWIKIFTDVASNFNYDESVRHLTTFQCISGPVQLNIKKRYRRYSYIPTKRLRLSIFRPREESEENNGHERDDLLFDLLGETEKVCSNRANV